MIARQAEPWYNPAMTEEVGTPLLATKLYLPPRRLRMVPRLRMVAFSAGEAPPAEEGGIYGLRRSALAEYHQSKEG